MAIEWNATLTLSLPRVDIENKSTINNVSRETSSKIKLTSSLLEL